MIHIGIGFDFNFYQHFFAWSTSLSKNNPDQSIHIHAICDGIPDESLKKIRDHVARFGKISFYEIDQDVVSRLVLINTWTASVYYRIFLPAILPTDISRLLYLDLDTLVLSDISLLYNIDMKNFPVAAIYDNYVRIQPDIGIDEEGKYFNSGVLLIDLHRWNDLGISDKAIEYLSANPGNIKFVDQCALNAVLKDNWLSISEKNNLLYSYIPEGMSLKQLKNMLHDVKILHYTLHRPWEMLCKNRFRFLYYHYLKLSGFQYPSKYKDFSIKKIPQWLRIRLVEFYLDCPELQNLWKKFKKVISA
jgi:lipopolysaccharide biosynthesis glycosyltransferase